MMHCTAAHAVTMYILGYHAESSAVVSSPPPLSPPTNTCLQEWLAQAATPINSSSSTGVFADSCIIHTQVDSNDHWVNTAVGGQSMRTTFADWYFGHEGSTKEVDCTYPCNPTCLMSVPHDPAFDLM